MVVTDYDRRLIIALIRTSVLYDMRKRECLSEIRQFPLSRLQIICKTIRLKAYLILRVCENAVL